MIAATLVSDPDILDAVEAFCAERSMAPTTFGRRAIGDANLIDNLKAGRELRRSTETRIRSFMAAYRLDQQDAA